MLRKNNNKKKKTPGMIKHADKKLIWTIHTKRLAGIVRKKKKMLDYFISMRVKVERRKKMKWVNTDEE